MKYRLLVAAAFTLSALSVLTLVILLGFAAAEKTNPPLLDVSLILAAAVVFFVAGKWLHKKHTAKR